MKIRQKAQTLKNGACWTEDSLLIFSEFNICDDTETYISP